MVAALFFALSIDLFSASTNPNVEVANSEHEVIPIQLNNLLTTKMGSRLLEYSVQCALRSDQTIIEALPGEKKKAWRGQLGLVPTWQNAPLSKEGERWISACVLARLNAFGKIVTISIRANHPAFLDIPSGVRHNYKVDEGTFYGNLFENPPRVFVCAGDGNQKKVRDRRLRVCTDRVTPDGALTRCGLKLTGSCSHVCQGHGDESGSYYQCRGDDQIYMETATVFLKGS